MMTSHCDAQNPCAWQIAWRVIVIVTYMVICLAENIVILTIYNNSLKKEASKLYIVAMAYLDLVACCVVLPQVPLWEFGLIPEGIFLTQALVGNQMYLFVQVTMVLDRWFAVYTPTKYFRMRHLLNKTMVVIFIVLQVYMQTIFIVANYILEDEFLDAILDISFSGTFAIGLLVISVVYPAIVYKLHKLEKKFNKVKPSGDSHVTSNVTISTVSPSNSQPTHPTPKDSSHTTSNASEAATSASKTNKILKLYLGILALFIITNVPIVVSAILDEDSIVYLFYLNSIGNGVIIYLFNTKFRTEVKNLFAKLKTKS